MNTTNPESLPQIDAGAPISPNALEALANQLFPDLDKGYGNFEAQEAEKVANDLEKEPIEQELASPAQSAAFNWDDPFNVAVDYPFQDPTNAASSADGYAPVVLSQTQAAQWDKNKEYRTSLGGDESAKKNVEYSSSQDESIRIGTKTLGQIRRDFPILSEIVKSYGLETTTGGLW